MTRLTRTQFASLKLLITGTDRRGPVRLLGLGDTAAAHLFRLAWVDTVSAQTRRSSVSSIGLHWNDGPRTPSGFLLLFDLGELVFSGVLLLALDLAHPVSVLTARDRRPNVAPNVREGRRAAIPDAHGTRVACDNRRLPGWEVHEWRTWRLRSDYLRAAAQASLGVESSLSALRSIREERPYIRGSERKG